MSRPDVDQRHLEDYVCDGTSAAGWRDGTGERRVAEISHPSSQPLDLARLVWHRLRPPVGDAVRSRRASAPRVHVRDPILGRPRHRRRRQRLGRRRCRTSTSSAGATSVRRRTSSSPNSRSARAAAPESGRLLSPQARDANPKRCNPKRCWPEATSVNSIVNRMGLPAVPFVGDWRVKV
jgi:hypothetical protein